MGIDGQPSCLLQTQPLSCQLDSCLFTHSFLVIPSCPTPLLGRDILAKLKATLQLAPGSAPTSGAFLMLLVDPSTFSVNPEVWDTRVPVVARHHPPVLIRLRDPTCFPARSQFPLSTRNLRGLKPIINRLMGQGLLIPTTSPCNTPILPVQKASGDYWLVQDLRLINSAVVPAHPLVPNPYTLLSPIPPQTSHFTVIDLKDAFFTIPLHPDCQFLFAFTWTDPDTQLTTQLTWTVLPQGFRDSPHYFGQALSRDLARCSLRPSTLLQYVDDLLLCSPSEETSRQHTTTLLNFLGSQGYRASQSKAQLTQTSVVYLGLQITPTSKALTADRCSLLRSICPPADGNQILSFLGLTGFFRHWVPNYATLAKPLYSAAKETPTEPLSSPTEVTQAFHALRSTLLAAPPLFLPNPNYPHHLYFDKREG